MRSHVRHAVSLAVIGVIALLVVPSLVRGDATRITEGHRAAQLTAITLPTADAPAPAPRGRPLDLNAVGVFLAAAVSIAFLWRATRRTSPYRHHDVRILGYGRLRGPPFASA